MILSCPACPKTYDVPSAALPPGGREVECSACGAVWFERGLMARAAAAGAAGADVAPVWDDVIEAEFQTVGTTEPRPAPTPAALDAEPAPSPAREQQTALTVAYDAGPNDAEAEAAAAREAARLLSLAAKARIKRGRDALLTAAGSALGTVLDLAERLRQKPTTPPPATPGDLAARATRARMQARAANALTPARALGWGVWGAAVCSVVLALTAGSERLRAAFPPAQSFYDLAVPPAAPPGLRVEGELKTYAVSSQGPALVLAGTVTNEGAADAVPNVTLWVRTPDGEAGQPVALPPVALPPGGERPFAVRALVPDGATAIRLTVAPGAASRDGLALQAQGDGWSAGHAGPPQLGGARDAGPR